MLWMLDDGVPDDLIKALELYCSAFFYGCKIVIRRPGEKWGLKNLPLDFFTTNKIKMRDDDTGPDR
jgi:hypothetical protein